MTLILAPAGDNGVRIQYSLECLFDIMAASANSLVPFRMFTNGTGNTSNRSYPRPSTSSFILGRFGEKTTGASSGGRIPLSTEQLGNVYYLSSLLSIRDRDIPVPLNDIVILSKRTVCVATRGNFKHFKVMGGEGLADNDENYPGWPVYGYPMLCVINKNQESDQFPRTGNCSQGDWRVVQCVFGAVLTHLIREKRIGLEVVSREGFGSVFPTLADLPNGIRLDPGLLPPDLGSAAIVNALKFVDAFIDVMRQEKLPTFISQLNGMGSTKLQAVDRLMAALLKNCEGVTEETDIASVAKHCAGFVINYNNKGCEYTLDLVDGGVEYVIENVLPDVEPIVFDWKRRTYEDEFGYGSDSDWEDEEVNPAFEKFRRQTDRDETDIARHGPFAVKKVSVVSGMAALRMATFYGMLYSLQLSKQNRINLDSSGIAVWAPYFELEVREDLWDSRLKTELLGHVNSSKKLGEQKKLEQVERIESGQFGGVHVLICDGAPNPINIEGKPRDILSTAQAVLEGKGVFVIDTTNNTSQEKAGYLKFFEEYLVPLSKTDLGGLILMVDSASKHPTGGDLVHGVMRVCGSRKSVEHFYKQCLLTHVKYHNYEAAKLTLLSIEETEARREMKDHRLVMRNHDLWSWL